MGDDAPPGLTWEATYELVLRLMQRYPDVDLDTVSTGQLHEWVVSLPDFEDDPSLANDALLTDLLREWWRGAERFMTQLDLRELNSPEFPIPQELQSNLAITSLSKLYNWSRRSSVWPLLFGLACCAIEMIASQSSRYDLSRFGMEVNRASPRQSDLMIVSGTVTKKMVVPIVRLYNQMPEPKYVLAMGACASGGGPFKEGYNVVSGIDKYLPVDVYAPGCPPTPQALIYSLIALQKKIDGQSLANLDDVPWYGVGPSEAVPVPILGPDVIDPRQMELIRRNAELAAQGNPVRIRELPASVTEKKQEKSSNAPAAAKADSNKVIGEEPVDPEKAARQARREAALARKRAAQGGE